MSSTTQLSLIDGDFRRRAAISHCLAGSGIHVEPFEDSAELSLRWPRSGILLVHDDGDAIADLFAQMGDCGTWLPVIGFSQVPDSRQIMRAAQAGVIDYVVWPFDGAEMAEIIAEAGNRARSLLGVRLREAMARSRLERLSRREREVLEGVAGGLSNRLIGEKLHISPRTVEIHRANMLNKMGANHTSEAIRIAIEAALVS